MTLHHNPSHKCSIEITNASALPGPEPGPSSQCSGELKSAGAVATLHSWDAWLMPPPPPPAAGCCRGELPTKFREIFTFFKTATCPQSYHWQAVLRIFSFSPSDVNMSRREISLTALLQKPQSCFKVAAVFTFVLQLAAVPAVVLPGSWMVFISHLKPERQDTSCALQPATTRTLSSYFYADKTRRHSEIFC